MDTSETPLHLDDAYVTRAGTVHLLGCPHLKRAIEPTPVRDVLVWHPDHRRCPTACAFCTFPVVWAHRFPDQRPLPEWVLRAKPLSDPNCTNCGVSLPLPRKGPTCSACAKREWRSRRTPEQQEAARAADRERKRRNAR